MMHLLTRQIVAVSLFCKFISDMIAAELVNAPRSERS